MSADALLFNQFVPSGLYYFNILYRSIASRRGVWVVFIIMVFVDIPVVNVNSVDSDQTLRSVASDLGLHCLPMPLLWDVRYKQVHIVTDFCSYIYVKE